MRAAAFAGLLLCARGANADPVDDVDPFIGVDAGNCIVGPTLPHGSIHPSPQTLDIYGDDWRYRPFQDGYSTRGEIAGFAQLHAQGTGGVPSYGQLLISPQVGVETSQDQHVSAKSNEVAEAGYYAVTLDRYGVACEVTPAHHAALYRFTFPAGVAPAIVFNVGRKIGGPSLERGALEIDVASGSITGRGEYSGNWRPGAFPLFYRLDVNVPPASWGVFLNEERSDGDTALLVDESQATDEAGAYLVFAPDAPREILVRIAVSFRDADTVDRWIDEEVGDWDFERVRNAAGAAWAEALSCIEVVEPEDETRRRFYTALYHTMTSPRNRTGDVAGFPENAPVMDDQITKWDTYRTKWPLNVLVQPDVVARNLAFYVETQRTFGFVGTADLWGRTHAAAHQGGTEVDNILADAFVKDVPSTYWPELYDIGRYNASSRRPERYVDLGYATLDDDVNPASATVAFSRNDFGVGVMALTLGTPAESGQFLFRSESWRNTWNADLVDDGYRGFVMPRNRDGSFQGDPAQGLGFYETTPWAASFDIPHAVGDVIEAMGGTDAFVARLEHAFREGYVEFDNEPTFFHPWLFTYAGRPDLTADHVRAYLDRYRDAYYPGQEDGGAMSSFYVFAASGFYPVAGQPLYLLHGPTVSETRWTLANGKELRIQAVRSAKDDRYVQRVQINGAELDRAWLSHEALMAGGTLRFHMGDTPSAWAQGGSVPSGLDAVLAASAGDGTLHVVPRLTSTGASFSFDVGPRAVPIDFALYDVGGRLVRRLLDEPRIGPVTVAWSGRTAGGRRAASGVYFYRLSTPAAIVTGAFPLVR